MCKRLTEYKLSCTKYVHGLIFKTDHDKAAVTGFSQSFAHVWDNKWVLAWLSFDECIARAKLELTDFISFHKIMSKNI